MSGAAEGSDSEDFLDETLDLSWRRDAVAARRVMRAMSEDDQYLHGLLNLSWQRLGNSQDSSSSATCHEV